MMQLCSKSIVQSTNAGQKGDSLLAAAAAAVLLVA
jgi:hypothetical protein